MIKTIIEKNLLAILGAYLVLFIATCSALAEGKDSSSMADNDIKASSLNYGTITVNLAASEVDILTTSPNNTSSSYDDAANIDKENIQQSIDNKVRCLYFPSFMGHEKDINVEKDLICRNSIELMVMAAYQTGNQYQEHVRFGYSHLWDRFRLDTKGSFQDVRKSDIQSQAADGSAKLALIADIYPYLLMGGHWRSNQRDFYYYSVGPGFKITDDLILEAGIGHLIAAPDGRKLMFRGALNFRYKFTDYWRFEEKLDVFVPLAGTVHYLLTSDTMFVYKITNRSAFKTGITYTSLDENWHRLQTVIGMDYKF